MRARVADGAAVFLELALDFVLEVLERYDGVGVFGEVGGAFGDGDDEALGKDGYQFGLRLARVRKKAYRKFDVDVLMDPRPVL